LANHGGAVSDSRIGPRLTVPRKLGVRTSAHPTLTETVMAKLTTTARKKLPAADFALPGGRYPVEDKAHARDAKARASQQRKAGNLTATEKATVDRKADAVLAKKSAR
jgi:hypothetical protein